MSNHLFGVHSYVFPMTRLTIQFKNALLDNPALLSTAYCVLVSKILDSVPGVDEELYNFLGYQWNVFIYQLRMIKNYSMEDMGIKWCYVCGDVCL